MTKLMNFIAGEAIAPVSGEWFSHRNPTTGEAQVEVPDSGMMDVVKAIQAANKAWQSWQKVGLDERSTFLRKIAERTHDAKEDLARAQTRDTGVPLRRSILSIERAVQLLRASAEWPLLQSDSAFSNSSAIFTRNRLPIGVVAILTPWSDPILSLASKIGPALSAGNVMIAKPSEFAPESSSALARLINDAGLPPGVFNLVHGRGDSVGAAIVAHPGLSTISFTGRTETGRVILRESAEFLKKTQLALGARNPALVFAEALASDPAKVMPMIVQSCFGFESMTCLRGSRLFVQESIYDRFLEAFQNEAAKLKIGDPLLSETDLGPLVNETEKNRFTQAIEQATGERGKILFGGTQAPEVLDAHLARGNFVRPTAIYDLTLCSTLQQEEVIGPFVSIASFKYQHDAIKQANNSPFGQAVYLFQPLGDKAARIATKLEASRIYINAAGPLFDPRQSWAGIKTSGLSSEGLSESISFFSRSTSIAQSIST